MPTLTPAADAELMDLLDQLRAAERSENALLDRYGTEDPPRTELDPLMTRTDRVIARITQLSPTSLEGCHALVYALRFSLGAGAFKPEDIEDQDESLQLAMILANHLLRLFGPDDGTASVTSSARMLN